jgi:hypothetical protein
MEEDGSDIFHGRSRQWQKKKLPARCITMLTQPRFEPGISLVQIRT